MMGTQCPKHVESGRQKIYLRNLVRQVGLSSTSLRKMHGKQNIKLCTMSYAFFWAIPRRLNVICRRIATFCLFHLHRRVPPCLWRWNRQSVAIRRHRTFRHRGIAQMKAYNIQNKAKVWNQEHVLWQIAKDFLSLEQITEFKICQPIG
jgi:hypothetical protein